MDQLTAAADWTGEIVMARFVRANETCSCLDECCEGCECANPLDEGTYILVRLDADPPIWHTRVALTALPGAES